MPRSGVQRWVDVGGKVRLAGLSYRVPITLAGEPVQCVVAGNLVETYHREVLVASHVQRRPPGKAPIQGMRRGRKPTLGPVVTRIADNNGAVSFAGTLYRAGRAWRGQQLQVAIVASSVQLTLRTLGADDRAWAGLWMVLSRVTAGDHQPEPARRGRWGRHCLPERVPVGPGAAGNGEAGRSVFDE